MLLISFHVGLNKIKNFNILCGNFLLKHVIEGRIKGRSDGKPRKKT
jgi:hypothetical protein